MTLPNVTMAFAEGQLGLPASANVDSVFAVIGASSLAPPNKVIPVSNPSSIPALLGYGPGPEVVAQILSRNSTTVYFVGGNKVPGTVPSSASQNRVDAPDLGAAALGGLPGAPVDADYNNTGSGLVFFDATSKPYTPDAISHVHVKVTTAGAPGIAHGDIIIGGTTHSNVTLPVTPWVDPDDTGIVLNFVVPLGGQFKVNDEFDNEPSPNDVANVVINITSLNALGQGQWTYSLDGGVNTIGPIASNFGNVITTSGLTHPSLVLTGNNPDDQHKIKIVFTQKGSATGVAAQCDDSTGTMTHTGPGLAVASVTSSGPTVAAQNGTTVLTPILTISSTGTAAGASTGTGGVITDGSASGTAHATLQVGANTYTFDGTSTHMPATFTDTTTGMMFTFSSASGNFTALATYTATVQPVAKYSVFVDDVSAATNVAVGSTGVATVPGYDIHLLWGHTNTDLYSDGSVSASNASTYVWYVYPAVRYYPRERGGGYTGFGWGWGFGSLQVGDQYTFEVAPPQVSSTDVINALTKALTTQGVNFSMVHVNAAPADFADAATIAASVQSVLDTQAQDPTWKFLSAVVYGPNAPSTVSGALPSDFVAATGSLALNRLAMSCGADYITSALTQRRDLRNCGIVFTSRLAQDTVEQDPGAVADGALANDFATTTSGDDATTFDANRGLTSRTFNGLAGVYCNRGLTLAGPGSDYSLIVRRRVIDKAANAARQALLPRVNSKVRTVKGTGTLSPIDANTINADVQGKVKSACNGNFQDVIIAASLTDDVLRTGKESVKVSVLPFAYLSYIDTTIGFTVG
jgi:hypothetical protein